MKHMKRIIQKKVKLKIISKIKNKMQMRNLKNGVGKEQNLMEMKKKLKI